MAQSKVFIAFAYLVLVFVSRVKADEANEPEPSPAEPPAEEAKLTEVQLNAFKAEVEKEIAEKKITCENHEEVCKKEEDDLGPSENDDKEKSVCRIILKNYLCKGPQNLDTIKLIAEKLMELANDVERENASNTADAPGSP